MFKANLEVKGVDSSIILKNLSMCRCVLGVYSACHHGRILHETCKAISSLRRGHGMLSYRDSLSLDMVSCAQSSL